MPARKDASTGADKTAKVTKVKVVTTTTTTTTDTTHHDLDRSHHRGRQAAGDRTDADPV